MFGGEWTERRIMIWGGGGLLLFILFAILITVGPIKRDAERRADQLLRINGHHWATVAMYGRGVEIGGVAPSEAAGENAVELVDDDWSSRRAWAAFTVAPPPAAPEPAVAAPDALPPLTASGPSLRDLNACQSLLDGLIDGQAVPFALNAATLEPQALPLLDALGRAMLRCDTARIEISGHTDATGDAAANMTLSQARADAVLDYLSARGVPRARLTGKGVGAEQPLGDNATEAGRALNRRIEFRIVGIGDAE